MTSEYGSRYFYYLAPGWYALFVGEGPGVTSCTASGCGDSDGDGSGGGEASRRPPRERQVPLSVYVTR